MICQHAFCCEKADTIFYIFITSPLELHACSECFVILFELKELICGLIVSIHEGFNSEHPVKIWNRDIFLQSPRRNLVTVFYLLRYLKELLEKLEVRITQSASISVIISESVEIVKRNCETISNFLDGRLSRI